MAKRHAGQLSNSTQRLFPNLRLFSNLRYCNLLSTPNELPRLRSLRHVTTSNSPQTPRLHDRRLPDARLRNSRFRNQPSLASASVTSAADRKVGFQPSSCLALALRLLATPGLPRSNRGGLRGPHASALSGCSYPQRRVEDFQRRALNFLHAFFERKPHNPHRRTIPT
jgi:hypothetical protein